MITSRGTKLEHQVMYSYWNHNFIMLSYLLATSTNVSGCPRYTSRIVSLIICDKNISIPQFALALALAFASSIRNSHPSPLKNSPNSSLHSVPFQGIYLSQCRTFISHSKLGPVGPPPEPCGYKTWWLRPPRVAWWLCLDVWRLDRLDRTVHAKLRQFRALLTFRPPMRPKWICSLVDPPSRYLLPKLPTHKCKDGVIMIRIQGKRGFRLTTLSDWQLWTCMYDLRYIFNHVFCVIFVMLSCWCKHEGRCDHSGYLLFSFYLEYQ